MAGGRCASRSAKAFNIEIDAYVFIGFAGVKAWSRPSAASTSPSAKPYYDAHYWVNSHTQGWGLPAGQEPSRTRRTR